MPSGNLENRPKLQLWKAETDCAEGRLDALMAELASKLLEPAGGAWVLLEGPMGAGKSTAARCLIRRLGVPLPPEGSPTFAIAHEYPTPQGAPVIHLDLYRLESCEAPGGAQAELEAAGVLAYFWERPGAFVLSEWTSKFPELEQALLEDQSTALWVVRLEPGRQPELRHLQIFCRSG